VNNSWVLTDPTNLPSITVSTFYSYILYRCCRGATLAELPAPDKQQPCYEIGTPLNKCSKILQSVELDNFTESLYPLIFCVRVVLPPTTRER
jgi:hypothetical protein